MVVLKIINRFALSDNKFSRLYSRANSKQCADYCSDKTYIIRAT